jgi:hypothetical protein
MKHRWAALAFAVLALSALMPRDAAAQSGNQPARERDAGIGLGQNYPNPFNPETRIPFSVGLAGDPPACADPARQYRVSLRIYNLLAQLVAIPVLQGGSGEVQGGQLIENLRLSCREYTAYWDGKYMGTQREVASGIYLYRLEVDGKAVVRKMIVMK